MVRVCSALLFPVQLGWMPENVVAVSLVRHSVALGGDLKGAQLQSSTSALPRRPGRRSSSASAIGAS